VLDRVIGRKHDEPDRRAPGDAGVEREGQVLEILEEGRFQGRLLSLRAMVILSCGQGCGHAAL
jgi:hypothetical protein